MRFSSGRPTILPDANTEPRQRGGGRFSRAGQDSARLIRVGYSDPRPESQSTLVATGITHIPHTHVLYTLGYPWPGVLLARARINFFMELWMYPYKLIPANTDRIHTRSRRLHIQPGMVLGEETEQPSDDSLLVMSPPRRLRRTT